MSTTILGGDITVYFLDENRQKRLEWTGTATGTRTVNEVYSALENLMDEALQSDDGSVMSAQTPVEYTLGIIDAGDLEPWYISFDMIEKLQGGAIRTSGWTRQATVNTGIVVVEVTSNTIVAGDVGLDITHADGDSGTLLEVIEQGATDYLVIRPDSNAAANNFDSTSGVLTCNANTATQAAAAVSGEMIWANAFNVTPIDADTHVYVYQGTVNDATRARIQQIDGSSAGDWWPEGAFDRLYAITNYKASGFPVIDDGYLTFFARKANTLYASFEVLASTTSGGRNPIPLSAANDLNHTTGWRTVTLTGNSGNFNIGDNVTGNTSGASAILTAVSGATLDYYLIGDPQVDFDGSEGVTNQDDTGTSTGSGAPTNAGPALATWFTNNAFPSITHANTQFDVDNSAPAEGYGITIDCNNNPLTEVYEWLQYITQNGNTVTTNTDGIEGEQYVGATVFLEYSGTVSGGTIAEGEDVLQANTGATGIVISHDTSLKQILLRDTRGTFNTTDTITSQDAGAGTITADVAATTFTPNTQAPYGSLAGGRFFGARGVLLANWVAADENNFQLTDSQGFVRERPIAITLEVTNLVGAAETASDSDLVSLHRLTGSGGVINKTEYSATGGETVGGNTLTVDSAITADTPGQSVGGTLVIRDATDNQEYKLRFSSWSGSVFTLAEIAGTAEGGTNTTTVVDTGVFATAKRGDFFYNTTQGEWAYVQTVDSANQITLDRAIAGQTSGDLFELNTIPNITVNTADDVFVPLMQRYATGSEESVSIVYVSPIFYRAKVTNKRNATRIQPFVTSDSTSGTSRSIAVIRNTDTIVT